MENPSTNHICFFSSGAASWLAAKRVAQKFGTENLYLVFADTGIEDEDNYRFLCEASKNVGGHLVWLKTGKTPWDIFFEKRFINHRQSNCSIELKVKPCKEWIYDCEFDHTNTTLYFGINFEEIDRLTAIAKHWSPFSVDVPLCWDDFGWADRQTIFNELEKEQITPPRMYSLGFGHANCGGFCPKAGLSHYRTLLKVFPERYAYHAEQEEKFRSFLGRNDIGILRRTINGKTSLITLNEWRKQIELEPHQLDIFEGIEGCSCFTDAT